MQILISRRSCIPQKVSSARGRNTGDGGYILLALLLVVTVLAIAALAIYPDTVRQVKRDREEELIHRGVQYARAVRKYYKKFNRYPNTVEELMNTNNIRFLRQKYKDPITGKEFKLLHQQDVQLSFPQGGIGGRPGFPGIPGLPGQPGGPGGPRIGPGAFGLGGGGVPLPPGATPPTAGTAGAGPDENPGTGDQGAGGSLGAFGPPAPATGPATGDDPIPPSAAGSTSSAGSSAQTFGGGAVLGVVSLSKAVTIREFNKKNHYNEWQFIYDPSQDRGGLLNAPVVGGQPGGIGGGTQPQTGTGKTDTQPNNPAGTPSSDGGNNPK